MEWNRQLTELEMRAFCDFVLDDIVNKRNYCEVVSEKVDEFYMNEGLRQTLYKYKPSEEYVFIVRQKNYIVDALHIGSDEIEEFKTMWEQGKLNSYGHLKTESPKK